jgi:predicted acetyltransferase
MLGLALCELRKLGETRALLTVNLDNEPSVRLITGNGGVLDSIGYESDGKPFGRYWIDLSGPLCA